VMVSGSLRLMTGFDSLEGDGLQDSALSMRIRPWLIEFEGMVGG
jgi:hypothetical protein